MPTPLAIARTQIGVTEGPRNAQPYSLPHYPNQPWCAQFVTWAHRMAGRPLPVMQAPGIDGFASCAIGLEYCRQHGWIVTAPEPGDLVFFISLHHVGFYTGPGVHAGSIETVEGNAGIPGAVRKMIRGVSEVLAYARVGGPCWTGTDPICPV